MKTVYIYPSPDNQESLLVKDKANNCFTFKEEIVDCNNRPLSSIFSIPMQA